MIIIPMLGRSIRFFNAGYTEPKYQLALGNESVFSLSVKSFKNYFRSEPFLFLVRRDYESRQFVAAEVNRLGLLDYRIVEFSVETRGEADSVAIGVASYHDKLPILIFNIDTIRNNFVYPETQERGDGFLEVFEGVGNAWSFVEPGVGTTVIRTSEKDRISSLCSNGLYFFTCLSDFREAFENFLHSDQQALSEIYVAPLYNYLINSGRDIRFRLVDSSNIDHCGIPADYERLKLRYNSRPVD